jgi:hypothetical protein
MTSGRRWRPPTLAGRVGRATTTPAATAWQLSDNIRSVLKRADRDIVYVALGSGNTRQAMIIMLKIAVQQRLTLPESLISELDKWLRGYADDRAEEPIHCLLEQARSIR